LAELRQVAAIVKSQPVSQPGAEFWENFHLELHRKLAQVNQAPVRTRPYRPYFLVAAGPALAVLVLWVGGYLTPVREPARPRLPMMAQAAAPQQLVYAGLDDGLWQEEEFPSWDVNAVLVDLPDHEQELVLKKVGY
jgi:alkylated DNA repair dioxygenase AlkB